MPVSFDKPLIKCTPRSWAAFSFDNIEVLLSDHAYCERKAALFALHLLQRYGHFYSCHIELSKLVREEMRHYELVLDIFHKKGLSLVRLAASGYAKNLRSALLTEEPYRHVQLLLIAAIIEARSCERFEILSEYLNGLDTSLSVFYNKLALAEKRHHLLYCELACQFMVRSEVLQILQSISELEQSWIDDNNLDGRMHSGTLEMSV